MSVADASSTTTTAAPARPWLRALVWLALLAPVFFLTYGFANWTASQRANVGSIVFDWERHIPFVPWTIVPYWTIDAFYGLSLFVCTTREELDTHGRRLLTAQIVAVTCFILFPLRFTFTQPATDGLPGFLFAALGSFDQPFNQAPSLHIALLVILWVLYARHVPRRAVWPVHIWAALVGISVLTTYQHHVIDIPTGMLLGFFCLWLWPDGGPNPLATARPATDRRRLVLAARYAAGSLICFTLAWWIRGLGLLLLWPAVSLLMVAANYALFGVAGFQKAGDGCMSLAARWLLAPYLLGAWINSRAWTRDDPQAVAIADDVWLGRIPSQRTAARFAAIVDLCAELPAPAAATCHAVPMLDLVAPSPDRLRIAAGTIESARQNGPVLVCCALGFSRSAAAVAAWLVSTGREPTVEAAIAHIRRARPRIVLDAAASGAIGAAARP